VGDRLPLPSDAVLGSQLDATDPPAASLDEAGRSVPQYLHLVAATGRSSERQAGQVSAGSGFPKTTTPRRLCVNLKETTITNYTTAMKTRK
jgi:hypothetical protein